MIDIIIQLISKIYIEYKKNNYKCIYKIHILTTSIPYITSVISRFIIINIIHRKRSRNVLSGVDVNVFLQSRAR